MLGKDARDCQLFTTKSPRLLTKVCNNFHRCAKTHSVQTGREAHNPTSFQPPFVIGRADVFADHTVVDCTSCSVLKVSLFQDKPL